MIETAKGTVKRIIKEDEDCQWLEVLVEGEYTAAVHYKAFEFRLFEGETVLLNVTARSLKLGTGGVDFTMPTTVVKQTSKAEGHLIKLRYTPLQIAVKSCEEEYRDSFPKTLNGIPVVACALHSQITPVCFAIKKLNPDSRIVYIMTDSAALPISFSKNVKELRDQEYISDTITSGQAFGGSYEAVNIYSALWFASSCSPQAIVVCQGPGNSGTGTKWGFSSIDQGITLNAAHTLQGKPICCLRFSDADSRERHCGISHHTRTVLNEVAMADYILPVPIRTDGHYVHDEVDRGLKRVSSRHERREYQTDELFESLCNSGLSLSSMGRKPEDDPCFWMFALAAGCAAAEAVNEP